MFNLRVFRFSNRARIIVGGLAMAMAVGMVIVQSCSLYLDNQMEEKSKRPEILQPGSYGNGVFFLEPTMRDVAGESLAKFRESHKIVVIIGDSGKGFWIITEYPSAEAEH